MSGTVRRRGKSVWSASSTRLKAKTLDAGERRLLNAAAQGESMSRALELPTSSETSFHRKNSSHASSKNSSPNSCAAYDRSAVTGRETATPHNARHRHASDVRRFFCRVPKVRGSSSRDRLIFPSKVDDGDGLKTAAFAHKKGRSRKS
jgi:hypothetical protein